MIPANAPFLDVAVRMGRRICRDAIWSGRRCNWMGWCDDDGTVVFRSLNADFHSGTAGIALFLARLNEQVSDSIVEDTIAGAIEHVFEHSPELPVLRQAPVHEGLAGTAMSLVELGTTIDDDSLTTCGLDLLATACEPDASGDDVHLSHLTSAIPVLLAYGLRFGRPDLIENALVLGEHLRDNLTFTNSESRSGDSSRAVNNTETLRDRLELVRTLLELYVFTDDIEYLRAAERRYQVEPQSINPSKADEKFVERHSSGGALNWSHGLVGAAFSLIRINQLATEFFDTAHAAEWTLNTITEMLYNPGLLEQTDYSLCHGIAGSLELLTVAAAQDGRLEWLDLSRSIAFESACRFESNGEPWPTGARNRGPTPSLMTGLAGIGHVFLRLHDPLRTPPLLLVVPPNRDVESDVAVDAELEDTDFVFTGTSGISSGETANDNGPVDTSEPAVDAMGETDVQVIDVSLEPDAAPPPPDDIQQIVGIGKVMEQRLRESGILYYAQISGWGDDEVAEMNKRLNARGRIHRDGWIGQAAQLLAEQQKPHND